MATKKPKARSQHLFRVPYAQALRVFAYTNKSYEKALSILGSMNLGVPPLEYAPFANQYASWNREARRSNPGYYFTPHHSKLLELYPIYEWILKQDCRPKTREVELLDGIMDDVNSPTFRKRVDILIYLKRPPEEIEKIIRETSGAGLPCWDQEQIMCYWKFFWNCDQMTWEDWRNYLEWVKPGNPTVQYVSQFCIEDEHKLMFQVTRSAKIPLERMAKSLISASYLHATELYENRSATSTVITRAQAAATKTLQSLEKFVGEAEKKKTDDDPLDRFRVILSAKEREQEGLSLEDLGIRGMPMSRRDVDGDISDPYIARQNPAITTVEDEA